MGRVRVFGTLKRRGDISAYQGSHIYAIAQQLLKVLGIWDFFL